MILLCCFIFLGSSLHAAEKSHDFSEMEIVAKGLDGQEYLWKGRESTILNKVCHDPIMVAPFFIPSSCTYYGLTMKGRFFIVNYVSGKYVDLRELTFQQMKDIARKDSEFYKRIQKEKLPDA